MVAKTIVAGKDELNEVPAEVMEQAIVDLAQAGRKLLSSRLNRRALLVLLKDATNVSFRDIGAVLDNLATLDEVFLKPKAKK